MATTVGLIIIFVCLMIVVYKVEALEDQAFNEAWDRDHQSVLLTEARRASIDAAIRRAETAAVTRRGVDF